MIQTDRIQTAPLYRLRTAWPLACAIAFLASPMARAADEFTVMASGVLCQPATATSVDDLDYLDGKARASAPAVVACPLPPVPPGYRQVRAAAFFFDGKGRWANRCTFFNNGSANHAVSVEPAPTSARIGIATFVVEGLGFPAHSAVCNLLRGQSLYAVEITVTPL